MGPSTFALGYAEGLGGLFAAAAAHKLLVLSRGRASEEALLQVTARRIKAAPFLLAGAATAEAGVAALVLSDAQVGLGVAIGLLTAYWRELSRLGPAETCACFGALARTPVRSAQLRNLVLGTAALVALVTLEIGGSVPSASAQSVAVALVVFSAIVLSSILLAQSLRVLSVRRTIQ